MTDRSQYILDRMRHGWTLLQTYQYGSYLLERGKEREHVYRSEVAPLFDAGKIRPTSFVGKPPGGYTPYEVVD